ncbi:MAG: hypothetical protein AAF637_20100 [Pseudomonadota bacterium]
MASARLKERTALGLVFILGVVLIVMAVPRLVAGVLGVPADRVGFHLRDGAQVTDEALIGMVAARRAALSWHETARAHRDIAAAALHLGHRHQDPEEYEAALQAVRRSLAMAPVDPHSWARLAHLAMTHERDALMAIKALRASIQAGAYEPTIDPWRVALMLRLWSVATVGERELFTSQIRQLSEEDPDALMALRSDARIASIIDAALEAPGSSTAPDT